MLPAVFAGLLALGRVERWWRRERAWRAVRAVGEIVAEFSDAGLGLAAGAERAFIEWRAFTHYRETPRLFLMYQGKTSLRYVPKSAFDGNAAALDEARRILHTHVRLTRHPGRQAAPLGFPVAPVAPGAAPGEREDEAAV